MSTTDEKGDDKRRNRNHRNRQDEDAKAKERGRRPGGRKSQSKTPGAESGKEGGFGKPSSRGSLGRSSSHKGLGRSSSHRGERRNQEEQEAKEKARSGRSSSSSRPGVLHERNSSDPARRKSSGSSRSRNKLSYSGHGKTNAGSSRSLSSRRSGGRKGDEKNGYHNRGSSTPGVQAESFDSPRSRSSRRGGSRKGDEKKGYRNKGASTPGVQAERSDQDRASRKKARNSNTRRVDSDGKIVPNGDDGDDDYAVHATIVGGGDGDEEPTEEEREARMHNMMEEEANRVRKEERRLQKEREELEKEKTLKQRRNTLIVVVLLVLIGGGVGAYFATQGSPSTNSVAEGDAVVADDTSESPSTDPTIAATNPPSQFEFKYPPPDIEDCQLLIDREPPMDEEGTIENREFEIDFDVGLSSADTDIGTVLPEMEQDIADWLLPPLVGCEVQRRLSGDRPASRGVRGEALRQLQTSEDSLRYMIADVLDIRAVAQEDVCSTGSSILNCSFVKLTMNVLLRGNELNLYVVTLLAEFFSEGENMIDEIGLSDDIAIFISRGIRATGPTKAPSVMPSWEPSVSPSDLPSKEPSISISASYNPSALVPEPTKAPSESPSTTPSATPSTTPTFAPVVGATPSPTVLPSATPSSAPSVAPAIGATPSPSKVASFMPTGGPSSAPSMMPSRMPSVAPVSACASLDLRDFDGQTVFGNDQNGVEHFYTFGASLGSWEIWDGTGSSISMSESSRDPSFLTASYSDIASGRSGQVSLLTTSNTLRSMQLMAQLLRLTSTWPSLAAQFHHQATLVDLH